MLVRRLRHSWRTRAHKAVLESDPELGAGGYVGGDQLLGDRPGLVDFDREADPDVGALGGRTTEGPQRGDDGVDQRWSGSPWRPYRRGLAGACQNVSNTMNSRTNSTSCPNGLVTLVP